MTLIIVLIYLALWVEAVVRSARNRFRFLIVFVFGLAVFFYLEAIPLELSIRPRHSTTLPPGLYTTSADLEWIAIFGVLLLGGFLAALASIRHDDGHRTLIERRTIVPSILLTEGFLLLIIILFFSANLISASSYVTNISQSFLNPNYGFMVKSAVIGWGALAFALSNGTKRASFFCAVLLSPLVVWSVYSNDKDPLLVATLTFLSVGVMSWRRLPGRLALISMITGMTSAAMILVLAFSVFRGGSLNLVSDMGALGFSFLRMDPVGPMRSLVSSLHGDFAGASIGASTIAAALMWVPLAIWPNRPSDLSSLYATTTMTDWLPGQGYGFSLAAEGLLFGGVVGVLGMGFVVGLVVGVTERLTESDSIWTLYSLIVIPYVLFLSQRGPLSMTFTNLIHLSVPFLLFSASRFLLDARCRSRSPSRRSRHLSGAAA